MNTVNKKYNRQIVLLFIYLFKLFQIYLTGSDSNLSLSLFHIIYPQPILYKYLCVMWKVSTNEFHEQRISRKIMRCKITVRSCMDVEIVSQIHNVGIVYRRDGQRELQRWSSKG